MKALLFNQFKHTMKKKLLHWLPGIFILVITGFVGLEIFSNHQVERVEDHSATLQKAVYGNDKQALINFEGKRISRKVDCVYTNPATDTGDSLTVFTHNGNQGYLSSHTGKIVIAARFDHAWQFDSESNLAAVGVKNRLGFINTQGEFVIPARYPYLSENFDDDFAFIFQDGQCVIPNLYKFGLINQKGEEVLPAVYSSISAPGNGYRIIMSDDKAGLFDVRSSKIIWPLCFEYLDFTENGIVVTDTVGRSFCKYLVSYDLKSMFPVYDDVTALFTEKEEYGEEGSYEDGKYTGYSTFDIDGMVGVLDDNTGKELFPAYFDDVSYYAPGKFKVTMGNYVGIIDQKGNIQGKEPFAAFSMKQINNGSIIPGNHE
jgi:hypothetical protein